MFLKYIETITDLLLVAMLLVVVMLATLSIRQFIQSKQDRLLGHAESTRQLDIYSSMNYLQVESRAAFYGQINSTN